jgi:hydrogenase maturation protease
MTPQREVLVACIGNVFHGDDGFGVEVARRLAERGAPPGANVVDFGIRGLDLAFALSSGIETAVLVDAAARGGKPGTLYVLEPNEASFAPAVETHAVHPLRAIELARSMGRLPRVIRVIACEPEQLGDDDEPVMGLSPPVEAAVEGALALVYELVRTLGSDVHHA